MLYLIVFAGTILGGGAAALVAIVLGPHMLLVACGLLSTALSLGLLALVVRLFLPVPQPEPADVPDPA